MSALMVLAAMAALARGAEPEPWKPPAAAVLEGQLKGTLERLSALEKKCDALEVAAKLHFDPVVDIRHAGVVLDDPAAAAENARILNQLSTRFGCGPGMLNSRLYVPGGATYIDDTWHLPKMSGIALVANGDTIQYEEKVYRVRDRFAGPASRIVYVGPPGRPAVDFLATGLDVQGTLVIQNGPIDRDAKAAPRDGTIGLLIDGRKTPPTGRIRCEGLALVGFDQGLRVDAPPLPVGSHGDNVDVGNLNLANCNRGVVNSENQAVGWRFGYVQAGGRVDTVFDFDEEGGGDFQCAFLALTCQPGVRVLDIANSKINSCSYSIQQIKVDASAKDWRLVRLAKPGPLNLKVWGQVGKQATPAVDAIDIAPAPGQFIDVRCFWNGAMWPPAGEALK